MIQHHVFTLKYLEKKKMKQMWQNVKLVNSGDGLMDVHYYILYFLVCLKLHDRK